MAGHKKSQQSSNRKTSTKKPTQTSHQPKKSVTNEALAKTDNRLTKYQNGQKLGLVFLKRTDMLTFRRQHIVELMTTLGCDIRMIPYNGNLNKIVFTFVNWSKIAINFKISV